MRVNALLTSCAAVLEMLGSAAVLLHWHGAAGQQLGGDSSAASLRALGWVTLGCQALLAASSLGCIVALPPPEAKGRVHLLREVFGLGGGGSSGDGGDSDGGGAADQREPLLDDLGHGSAATSGLELAPSSPRAAAEPHRRPAAEQQQGSQAGGGQCVQTGSQQRGRSAGALFDDATKEFLRCRPPAARARLRLLQGFWRLSAHAALCPLLPPEPCPLRPAHPCPLTPAPGRDGANMFIRSMTLQLTFFMALAAASRLGTASLAGGAACKAVGHFRDSLAWRWQSDTGQNAAPTACCPGTEGQDAQAVRPPFFSPCLRCFSVSGQPV